MKIFVSSFLLLALCSTATAQLKTTPLCPEIVVNILEGNVSNKIEPGFTAELVKKMFPCFTPDSSTACGEMVAYKDKDIYFYTERGYIEIREKYKGKMSIPLIGAARSALFPLLGNPTIKDVNWDAFQTAYGLLILHYNAAGKINLIQFTKKTAQTLSLCE